MNGSVGIDAIGVYVPRLYVDLTGEWAQVRAPELGEPSIERLVGKLRRGVGVERIAVPDAHEDSATMAAMAAKQAIDRAGIDPRDIDYLTVGTETTVDQSKSMGAYVLGMLEQHYGVALPDVGCPQVQFACIGATYALEAAVNRIRAGENRKPYALVIATDVSRYPLRSPGEYTQGAGAVALLVRAEPRLLALEPGLMSTVTRDERDFFRPNWSATAVVDGKYSIGVYLDCIEAAWHQWTARYDAVHGFNNQRPDQVLDYLLFHVPFPRMAEYAAARILGTSWLRDPAQRAQLTEVLPNTATLTSGTTAQERSAWERQLAQTALFEHTFARKTAPGLSFGREVGNIYSGSLYAALATLFASAQNTDLTGRRVGLFSYGSGASAVVWSGIVASAYREVQWDLDAVVSLQPAGGRRVPLELGVYERLHSHRETSLDLGNALQHKLEHGTALSADETQQLATALSTHAVCIHQPEPSVVPPAHEFALIRLGTDPHDWGYRYYAWIAG